MQRLVSGLSPSVAVPPDAAPGQTTSKSSAAPDPIRLLCVTHDAGQGKSALLRWLQKEIHRAAPGQLAVLTDVKHACLPQAAMLERLCSELGLPASGSDWLVQQIREGRVTFLLDALDQAPAGLEADRLRALVEGLGAQCRFVVARRPQAIGQHWDKLFQPATNHCKWRFLQMAYFTEEQQECYLGSEVFNRIASDAREILGVPRALYYLRRLAGTSAAELDKVRNASGVYFYTVTEMVREGRKAEKARGLPEREALLLLGAIAFEMVVARNFDRVGGGELDAFMVRVALRGGQYEDALVRAATGRPATLSAAGRGWNREWCAARLEQFAAMNEMLSCGLLEHGCPEAIQWRNRSLQEFFAAYWLAQGCQPEDQRELWQRIHLPDDQRTADFYWLWRFLAEMPAGGCSEAA